MSAPTKSPLRRRIWRSFARHGLPDSNRNRSLAVFSNFFLHFHPVKVRLRAIRFTRTFYLGGLTAACFFILTTTGFFLMFYYRPAVPHAYDDMKDFLFVVSSGKFLRNLHRWTAHVMVGLVFAHMAWTFLRGAYKPPREFNWVLGVGLLVATLLLSYTGYLLPWDQLAYWAVTVGTNMVASIPLVGDKIKLLLLGGHVINDSALLRFYVLHCVLLPMALALGIGLHVWRVRKDGGIHLPPLPRPPAPVPVEDDAVRLVIEVEGAARLDVDDEPMVMTFPHLLLREVVAFLALALSLAVASLLFDAPLEAIADPSRTPNPAKAPWYFLGLQEALRYYPPVVAGVLLPALSVLALAVVPYFRVNVERPPLWETSRLRRLALLWLAIAGITALLRVGARETVWAIVIPLWLVAATMSAGAMTWRRSRLAQWLGTRSLPFWIFTWFFVSAITLTVIGAFFRGPSWRLTLPWRDGIY